MLYTTLLMVKKDNMKTDKLPYFKFGNPTTCTYCGDTANSIDHVIAVSYQTDNRSKSDKTKYGPITPCCMNCNKKLFNKYFDTFDDRCNYISIYYRKQITDEIWKKGEISQLDYYLRENIKRYNAERLFYTNRADWFKSSDYIKGLQALLWEPILDKSSNLFNKRLYTFFSPTLQGINYF